MHYVKKIYPRFIVCIFKKIYCATDVHAAINRAQLFVNGNAKDIFSSIKETADAALKISRESGQFNILHVMLFHRFNNVDLHRP